MTALRGTSVNPFTVGSSSDGNDLFLGAIDDVVVCGRALAASEVLALKSGTLPAPSPLTLPGYATAPIACTLRMVEGVATIAWPAEPGRAYRVQFKDYLSDEDWRDLTGDIFVPGIEASVEIPRSPPRNASTGCCGTIDRLLPESAAGGTKLRAGVNWSSRALRWVCPTNTPADLLFS